MRLRPSVVVVVSALMGALVLGALGAAAHPIGPNPFTRIPAAGTGPDGLDFLGTLNIREFAVMEDQLFALGSLSGRLTHTVDSVAVPVSTVADLPVRAPVIGMSATCEMLDVMLGPLRPEPLGFAISVNAVHVESTAQGTEEEPAGDLACSIAGLLAHGAPLHAAGDLLNPLLESLS